MKYAILNKSIVTIWGSPAKTLCQDGREQSTIADEGLYGMGVTVTGEEEQGFWPVRTHYGYTGYARTEDLRFVTLAELQAWEASDLMVVSGICVDVTSIPKVQGVVYQSVYRGALVQVLAFESQEHGWAKVALADGRVGYMRNQFLMKKRYSQAGLWEDELPQSFLTRYREALLEEKQTGKTEEAGEQTGKSEEAGEQTGKPDKAAGTSAAELEQQFREQVAETALSYLGVQYRWGGKSTAGIDCSGLTSTSYMLNGVLTYRDAQIQEGFPVHKISPEQIKKGDLLYFPGHIALYLGDGRYVHSTGQIGSGGVVINSLNPQDEDYREDLVQCLKAVGSIF